MNSQNIILFDGVCNLCNAWVDFILKFDRKKIFYFSSLQSETAKQLLSQLNYQGSSLSSIIFIDIKVNLIASSKSPLASYILPKLLYEDANVKLFGSFFYVFHFF